MPFRSISTNNVAANPQTITAPAGIQNGDILVAFVVADASTATDPPLFPTGFTEVTGSPLTSTADGQRLFVATKKANAESGNYTLGAAAGDGLSTIGGILCMSGEASVSFVHRVATGASSTANASPWTITSGSYTGGNTTAAADLVWISASDVNNGGLPSGDTATPSGFTSRAQFDDGGFLNIQVFTQDAVAAGDTGARSTAVTDVGHTAGWGVFVIALLNASTGGGGWVSSGTRQAPSKAGPFDRLGFLASPYQKYSYAQSAAVVGAATTLQRKTLSPLGTHTGGRQSQ